MSKLSNFTQTYAFKSFMQVAYGLGAAVVIAGAMFKILHLPGADLAIAIGMSVEVLVFALSSLEPIKEDPDWSLVYPELAGMDPKEKETSKGGGSSKSNELDQMLEAANIDNEVLEKLGDNFRNLNENVSKMSDLSDATAVTEEYTQNVKLASENVNKLNESYTQALEAVNSLSETQGVSKEYYEQLQSVTQKLGSLNSMYELEIQESDNYVKQLNNFQSQLSKTMENLSNTEEASANFKDEFNKLNTNIANLNQVYGNMLSAMGGAQARSNES